MFQFSLWLTVTQILSAADGIVQHSYSGSLIQPGAGDGEILRRFEVQLFSQNNVNFFHVVDDLRSGCPWPDSFGETGPAAPPDKVQPHLVYSYNGTVYQIGLPPLILSLPQDARPESVWEQHGWQMTILDKRTQNGTAVLLVEARERRGRQQQLIVDAATGFVIRGEADVFMGQGDQFQLTVARSSVTPLEMPESAALAGLQSELMALQASLGRRPDAWQSELTKRQVDDVAAAIASLAGKAEGSPLKDLVRRIATDLESQQKRLASAASRATQLFNSEAPAFTLRLIGGGTLESASLKGKTVVLHFWDYRDSPLSEPYGQTGYLEFLFNRRKSTGVQVIGVSTNPELQSDETLGRGRRAARKLSEFMNLTYPVGYDDGSLLELFGDPRDTRGQLPLWIVVSPQGKVAHYHAGFYEIDAAQGLRDLEAVLAEQSAGGR